MRKAEAVQEYSRADKRVCAEGIASIYHHIKNLSVAR